MMPSRKHNSQYWMPSIFNDFFDDAEWPVTRRRNSVPAINIIESDKGYKVEVAAPGLKKEDFNIHLTEDNELVISMQKEDEKKEDGSAKKYLRREFSYSRFQQSFILPDDVDRERIGANVADGVLTVDLPKRLPEARTAEKRVIEIK